MHLQNELYKILLHKICKCNSESLHKKGQDSMARNLRVLGTTLYGVLGLLGALLYGASSVLDGGLGIRVCVLGLVSKVLCAPYVCVEVRADNTRQRSHRVDGDADDLDCGTHKFE